MEFTSAAPELIVYKSFKRFHTSFVVIKIVMPNPDSFYNFLPPGWSKANLTAISIYSASSEAIV